MFNGNGYQVNGYNENDVQRLSNISEGEDPIAQAMGMQQQQPTQDLIYRNQQPLPQRQVQPIQQINANGRAISIAISPDGTITITIN